MIQKMLEEQVIDGIEDKEGFWEMVNELRSRFRDLSDEQAQAMLDRAIAAAKSEDGFTKLATRKLEEREKY